MRGFPSCNWTLIKQILEEALGKDSLLRSVLLLLEVRIMG